MGSTARGAGLRSTIADPRTGEIVNACEFRRVENPPGFSDRAGLLDPSARTRLPLSRPTKWRWHAFGNSPLMKPATPSPHAQLRASIVNRSSVMDYPSPTVSLGADAGLTFRMPMRWASAMDKVSIMYGYSDLIEKRTSPGVLDKILSDAFSRGLLYLTDRMRARSAPPAPWRTSGTRAAMLSTA